MFTRRHLLHALTISALAACTTSQGSDDDLADLPSAPVTPPIPRQSIQRIALTSCSNPARSLEMLDQVRAKRPELLLMLGDNVYGSSSPRDPALPDLRAAYTKMSASTEFKSLVSQVPTLAIWDDHDFGINDGGGDFAHKALAQAMFNRFWNVPQGDIRRRRQGIYRAFMVGPAAQRIQVILLDTRMFRDPLIPTDVRGAPGKERYLPHPEDATVGILGADQWTFLEAELKKPATLRIIASSIQVVANGHGYESWALFPAQRRRLYRLIEQTQAKGVMFVSGDRHHGSINRMATDVPYPLTDFTASAINMPSNLTPGSTRVSEASTTRVGDGYGPVNFGMLSINWTARNVGFELIGETGAAVLNHVIPFAEIGAA